MPRPNRPAASAQGGMNGRRANINIGAFIPSAASGGLNGNTAGPTAADTGKDFSGVGPEEGYHSGGNEITPSMNPSTGNFGAGGMPANFTPYSASWLQNALSGGQAGMQANQLNNSVLLQQMAGQNQLTNTSQLGQNQLANTSLEGQNQIANTQEMGNQNRQTYSNNTVVDLLKAAGLEPTPENIASYNSHTGAANLATAAAKAQTGSNNAGTVLEASASPQGKAAATSGFLSSLVRPTAENNAMSLKLGVGDTGVGISPTGGYDTSYGGTPAGTSSTSTTTRDKLGNPTVTDTTTPSFNPGSGPKSKIPIKAPPSVTPSPRDVDSPFSATQSAGMPMGGSSNAITPSAQVNQSIPNSVGGNVAGLPSMLSQLIKLFSPQSNPNGSTANFVPPRMGY